MQTTIIKTDDGSHSLYIKDLNEHYHSTHGAIQESKHVFINAGLKHLKTPSINILEIGFGTGLNALLTFIETESLPININYTALEAYPISTQLASELNYANSLNSANNTNLISIFNQLHAGEWEKEISLSKNFTIHKIKGELQHVDFNNKFNLIYFDAFSPSVQPELWTETIFKKIIDATQANGVLVTYCAKGEVKRILKKVGFMVESLQGPPGKREMTRAVKQL